MLIVCGKWKSKYPWDSEDNISVTMIHIIKNNWRDKGGVGTIPFGATYHGQDILLECTSDTHFLFSVPTSKMSALSFHMRGNVSRKCLARSLRQLTEFLLVVQACEQIP